MLRNTDHNPVDTIQASLDEWKIPYVELDIFGTSNAQEIVDAINTFCKHHLDSIITGYLFYSASVGSTHGVRLEDGREVVIKVRPYTALESLPSRLEIICNVMRWLHGQGYPCPQVIIGPTSLGKGIATVEEFFDRGVRGNAFDPAHRALIARGLAELIRTLRAFDGNIDPLKSYRETSSLYPKPHGRLFDFEKTAAGAEWIDDFARRARQNLLHHGKDPLFLSHCDWRSEHLRFQEGKIVATYDWDSLALRTEPEIVGISAHGFTADWSLPDARRIPTGDDIRSYISEYERFRDRAFSSRDRRSVFSHCVYWIAYGARCQHSLNPDKKGWEPDTFPFLLRTEGDNLLKK